MHKHSWYSWAFYTGLAALILGPLLLPGYVLTLDLGWGPHLAPASPQDNGWLLHQALAGLMRVLPAWVVEKLLLASLFVLAGVGLQRLAIRTHPGWPAWVAGILYVANPFTYERFLAGQWAVLGGYALLPWLVAALVSLLERPGPRRAVILAIWAIILATVSLHTVGMAALIALAVCVAHAWGRWGSLRRSIGWLGFAAALWLAACSLWLVPLLLRHSDTARLVAGFDAGQYAAFATTGGRLGVPLNVLTLQGFWGDARGFVAPASGTGVWFWLATIILAAVIGAGLAAAVRSKDRLALALATAGAIAWVLAMGVAWPPSAFITHLLVDRLPFYRGYREPEKWAAVLSLAYAYLAAAGFQILTRRLQGFWRFGVAAAAALLPFVWVPLLFWAAAGQIITTSYPATWYQLDRQLAGFPAAPAGHPDTLMLPWHQYLDLDFARRTVANPAINFFTRPVIVSGDPELPGLTPSSSTGLVASIQNDVINRRFFEDNAGSRLSALGVHYVVLLKVSDWDSYGWLGTQSDLRLIAETPEWQLFSTQVQR